MGQNADELRRDIESTRDGLSDTLEAIGDRVSPGRVLERRKNRAVLGIRSLRDRVMGSASVATDGFTSAAGSAVDSIRDAPDAVRQQAQGSPVAAGAIAFGVGFLIAATFPPTQSEQHVAHDLMDEAEPLKDELASAGRELAEQVKGAAQDAVEEVKNKAADSKQAVADTVRDGVDSATATTQEAAASITERASS